ncbi:glutamine synthetase family protein [Marinoscillum sp. MHG1-6]|uniref:glutamine synthetase family protein n=1 Tax=Marinoscillum sp. MHG1-6 TaxID=2959627 RepID=UPI0021584B9C|nr:glutamine synthetase [Marinoscillum sp. MHG1-6]
MAIEHIIQKLKESDHNKVRVAITDIDGVMRGKLMLKEKFLSALESGFGFCDVVFGWDMADESYDNVETTGWHTGYPDAEARIDLKTCRELPWDDHLPFLIGDFSRESDDDLPVCPRSVLKQVAAKSAELGYHPVFSQEFEWFNFQETPKSLEEKSYINPEPLTPGMFGYSILRSSQNSGYFNDLFDLMEQFDVPLEGLHTETGPGVYEAAIQYSEVIEAADRATLFKTGVKEIAYKYGVMASFMAKWSRDLPGCSGHVHQSLWKNGKNVFFNEKDPGNLSQTMRSYMAGQLTCLPELLPMIAPTINSYKRLVEGAWAPTTLTWGVDNRTTALRALPGSEKSCRLETRIVGSDVNPYLAMAACLASGLYGIEQELNLEVEETIGNGYLDKKNGILPVTLAEATAKMKKSKIARELFGDSFVNHFTASREWECRQFNKAVTNWELKRYFEII